MKGSRSKKIRMHKVNLTSLLLVFFMASLALAAPKIGSPAPRFKLPDLFKAKVEYSLADWSGKVVLVDFWASWCAPCRATLPELSQLQIRNPELVVLALSVDEDKAKAQAFLKNQEAALIYLHDIAHSVAEDFDLGGMPSAYLIDKKGLLRQRLDGYVQADFKKLEPVIKKLLEEKP